MDPNCSCVASKSSDKIIVLYDRDNYKEKKAQGANLLSLETVIHKYARREIIYKKTPIQC